MTTESPTVEVTDQTASAVASGNEVAVEQVKDAKPEAAASESFTEQTDSGAKRPSTSLEAAKAAIGVAGTAGDSPNADKKGTDQRPAESPAENADKGTAIDKAIADKSVPFHDHPRWKEVTTAAKALESQVGDLTPKAQRWDALDAKFQETGLAPEDVGPLFDGGAMLKRAGALPQEVNDLMKVGAALKLGDREVVLQLAEPVFATLGLQLVPVLPKEIQEQVELGAISEDAGRRMADAEFGARRERVLRERAEQRVSARDTADSAASQQRRFMQASASWEQRVKATDADWVSKEPHIVTAIQALVKQREPTTEAEVVAICQEAYDQVTRILKSAGGAKPKPAMTPARSGSSTTTAPVPRSSLEAAKLAIRR